MVSGFWSWFSYSVVSAMGPADRRTGDDWTISARQHILPQWQEHSMMALAGQQTHLWAFPLGFNILFSYVVCRFRYEPCFLFLSTSNFHPSTLEAVHHRDTLSFYTRQESRYSASGRGLYTPFVPHGQYEPCSPCSYIHSSSFENVNHCNTISLIARQQHWRGLQTHNDNYTNCKTHKVAVVVPRHGHPIKYLNRVTVRAPVSVSTRRRGSRSYIPSTNVRARTPHLCDTLHPHGSPHAQS